MGRDGAVSDVTRNRPTELFHRLPVVLPGDRVMLYTVRRRLFTWGDEEIVAHVRATGERTLLLRDAADARYVASGHLLFMRRGVLYAVPFDPERVEISGQPAAVQADVAQSLISGDSDDATGAGQFAVSSAGALAWIPGGLVTFESRLVTVDRAGRTTPLPAPAAPYVHAVRVSPSGGQLAMVMWTLEAQSLWIYDLARGTRTPVVTKDEVFWPQWTPDGRRLLFNWLTGGRWTLTLQSADGSPGREMAEAGDLRPSSWEPDGRHFVATGCSGLKDCDVWRTTLQGSALTKHAVFKTPEREITPEISPDGRYIAYQDQATDPPEIYVQPYPGLGPRVQVSVDGGRSPAWSRHGRELLYLAPAPDGVRMMAVSVDYTPGLALGRARLLFTSKGLFAAGDPIRGFDVTPDGERFFTIDWRAAWTPAPPVTHIDIVENWVEELKARVPSGLTQ